MPLIRLPIVDAALYYASSRHCYHAEPPLIFAAYAYYAATCLFRLLWRHACHAATSASWPRHCCHCYAYAIFAIQRRATLISLADAAAVMLATLLIATAICCIRRYCYLPFFIDYADADSG